MVRQPVPSAARYVAAAAAGIRQRWLSAVIFAVGCLATASTYAAPEGVPALAYGGIAVGLFGLGRGWGRRDRRDRRDPCTGTGCRRC
jgi:hypothetical protein